MNKNIYCTLDTETIGGATKPTGMYNAGCVIHDKQGNIYATCSLLVMEHYDKIRNDSYTKKNFNLYNERLERGNISAVATEQEAYEVIRNLCKMYNVKYVMAYNSSFDFTKTIFSKLLDEFEFIDIYLMALQTITHLKKYANFCKLYNLISRSGKSYATSAEAVYAYITDNPCYEEEHTALNDSLIEMEIFKACDKMHKKYTRNCHQYNCKENKCFPKKN